MFAYSCRVAGRAAVGPAAAACVAVTASASFSAESAASASSRAACNKASRYAANQLLLRTRQLQQQRNSYRQQQPRSLFTTTTAAARTSGSHRHHSALTTASASSNNSSVPLAANANKYYLGRLSGSSSRALSSSSSKSGNGGNGGGFLEWYEGHLQSRPVWTKMVTGMTLWSIGDAVAQVVPVLSGQSHRYQSVTDMQYDWVRTGRAASFGFALHAPTSHLHFNFLEWMTNRVGVTGLGIPVFKAFMEQFVYWSWVSNSMYHAAMGAMQGLNGQQIYDRIADVLWDTQKAQWVFWIPVQLLNFQFVPVRHQLNVVLLTSIVWTALLSMWYPPLEEETEEEKQNPHLQLNQKNALRAVKPE